MALAVLGWRALRRPAMASGPLSAEDREREASIPYAPAIALGVWLSLVPKG
jgi:Flp pilus assembly protein protease CpaA